MIVSAGARLIAPPALSPRLDLVPRIVGVRSTQRERYAAMLFKLVKAIVFVAITAAVVQSMPDIARRLRSM
jgi:hypothetical protein